MSQKVTHKLVIAGGKEGVGRGLTKQVEVPPEKFRLVGMKIGDEVNGATIGFPGYTFKITGGSDEAGIPMRFDVHGPVKKRIYVRKRGVGYKPRFKGQRRWKMVRGNEINEEIAQVNMIVTKYGKAKLFEKKDE
ncbi:MAG: S6e family ribosomal protein [Promethearchaeota archaeon]